MFEAKLLINAEDVDAAGAAVFERRSPISERVVTVAAAASVADARHAANVAAAAFPQWAASTPEYRRRILLNAAEKFEDMRSVFRSVMYEEIGATEAWVDFNIDVAGKILIEAASLTTAVGGEVVPSSRSGSLSLAYRQPAGVCLGIAPWNAPLILGIRAIAMPLACGNTVLLKGSELCPCTHRLIGELMRDAGLPPGVLNIIPPSAASISPVRRGSGASSRKRRRGI
jgi:vanillin dehydrogenase